MKAETDWGKHSPGPIPVGAIRQLLTYYNGKAKPSAVDAQVSACLFELLRIKERAGRCEFSVDKGAYMCELEKGHAGPCGSLLAKHGDQRG